MPTTAPSHPIHAGPLGAAWYSVGQISTLVTRLVFLAVLGYGMGQLSAGNFDAITPALLLLFGVLVAALVMNRYVSRLAWAEVPGAFGWHSSDRGDAIEPNAPSMPDLAWDTARAGTWIVGAVVLADLGGVSAPIRVGVVAGFGAWCLGGWAAYAATSWWREAETRHWIERLHLFALIESVGWLVPGLVVAVSAGIPALWTLVVAAVGLGVMFMVQWARNL